MAIAEADARSPLADALRQILGNDNVLTDADNRRFYSSDVYREAAPAEIVIRPGGTEDLQRAVKAATLAGYAVFPRGGGLSYTDGYLPDRQKAVMVDLLRLKKIIEINAEDMYVTVEPAVSWAELYEALKAAMGSTEFKSTIETFQMITIAEDPAQSAATLKKSYDDMGTLMKEMQIGLYAKP